ncbi:hypothetical protein ABZ752_33090 [Streptomyces roseifaciens]
MILKIDLVNGLIVVIACLAGYLVYRRTAQSRTGQPAQGDLAMAIAAAAAVVAVLAFLFGVGGEHTSTAGDPDPTRTPTAVQSP